MSQAPVTENTKKLAAILAEMSADDCTTWLLSGFRALSGSAVDQPPFGAAYAYLQTGDDVTEDLAAAYRLLEDEGRGDFIQRVLGAAVRRFNVADEIDQRALTFALRFGARIHAFGLLSLIVKKSFEPGATQTQRLTDLQGLAIDVAVELASGSADAVESLRDVVSADAIHENVLSAKAPALLLALCNAKGDDLMDHLFRLEDALASHFEPEAGRDEDSMVYGRALLVTDLSTVTRDHILGGVIDFALAHREWRLAWLGDVLVNASAGDVLAEHDAERGRELLERLKRSSRPAERPHWVKPPRHHELTQEEHRRYSDILTSDTIDPETLDEALMGLMADFSRGPSANFGRQVIEDAETYE